MGGTTVPYSVNIHLISFSTAESDEDFARCPVMWSQVLCQLQDPYCIVLAIVWRIEGKTGEDRVYFNGCTTE